MRKIFIVKKTVIKQISSLRSQIRFLCEQGYIIKSNKVGYTELSETILNLFYDTYFVKK